MCSGVPSVDEARLSAEYVFTGRIYSIEEPGLRPISETDTRMVVSTGDMIRYLITPTATWKGAVVDTLVVYSARSSVSCGFEMMLNGEYLLYARLWDPTKVHYAEIEWAKGKPTMPVLIVDLCSRNKVLTTATQDVEELGVPVWRIEEE